MEDDGYVEKEEGEEQEEEEEDVEDNNVEEDDDEKDDIADVAEDEVGLDEIFRIGHLLPSCCVMAWLVLAVSSMDLWDCA